ncbi:MAG TPA: NADP-dependent glyceraldehyde-3-phosphate dehydrogenase [Planctomycetaceae bacterium]|nr:NADP-dependent glyceraldehyde-3-phosphate dehydrogenase [Planctomycetaceae bacterium]
MATPKRDLSLLFPASDAIPPDFASRPVEQEEFLVDGALRAWDGPSQEVFSAVCVRRDGRLEQARLGRYPLLDAAAATEALEAACAAYDHGKGEWPTMSVERRIRHVQDFTFRMKQHRREVVNLLMWEIGKPLPDSEKEFDRTVAYIEDTIDALKDLDRISSRFVIEQGILGQIRRAPLGVVLCMGPYNYPLNETFTTLIPALLMGNTVIFKPPRLGVLLHRPLLEAFRDAFPSGVVNTVYGEGPKVIGPLMTSGRIDVLAFIGSSRVADILKKQHPKPHRLRSVLGLEAKNAGIVLPCADVDLAVKECVLGSLSYNGQRCTALKMLFVHESVRNVFLERFVAAVNDLKVGMPWDKGAVITPLPDLGEVERMRALVADAVAHGAAVVNDGGQAAGTLFAPAVVYPASPVMRLYREEQFGPVVPVATFDDVAEPVRYIRESEYGQQVSIFGSDPDRIGRMIDPLVNQVCRVNLNSQCQRGPDTFPFTGRKASAEGTLSVSDALRVFAIRTLVAAKMTDLNKEIVEQIVRERKSTFLSTDFLL